MRALPFFFFLYAIAVTSLLFSSSVVPDHNLGFCADHQNIEMTTLGGLQDSNAELESLARFAVDHHNAKENASLELVRVVKAQEQVVSGKLHHLTLEVVDSGKKKHYEAKIWVKPWMNFKEVQEFKHVPE